MPVQGHNRDAVIRYIRVGRAVMDSSRNMKFNGGVYWGSHKGHWERSGVNGNRNSEGQKHRNGAGFGVKKSKQRTSAIHFVYSEEK